MRLLNWWCVYFILINNYLLKFSGWVHRITWEGEVLFSFRICDIPFTIDQSQERSSKLSVIHLRFKYSVFTLRISTNHEPLYACYWCCVKIYILLRINLPIIHQHKFYPFVFRYCPLMGGICLLLSDGRAALLISTELDPKTELSAIWVPGLNNATCCEVNHKFRLLYFGTTK